MAELLLELLSEEIPARMQARAADDLKRLVGDGLKAAGLEFSSAEAFATPRRLALVVDGLPVSQPDLREEKKGPRVGSPEKAIEGFLKGAGLASIDQAEKRDTGKGEFYFAVIEKKGGRTEDVLPGIVLTAMAALPWPKSMKWGDGSFAWVRPLQGVLAIFDGKALKGEVALGGTMAPVVFGDRTVGHRFHAPQSFAVTSFADYRDKLKKAYVVLDAEERKALIKDKAAALAKAEGLSVRDDIGLLDEVAGLVEWPVPYLGRIDEAFMEVPQEVLVTSMRAHQKYFACLESGGALAPRFVVVANTRTEDGGKVVVAGNERVLRARLSDAKFFWDQDRKVKLAERVPALKDIVFHARLGTVAEKVDRIQALAAELLPFVPHADADLVRSAATLCKADLVTGMVGEFPELQGIMGRYYALHELEKRDVADAIAEHYRPLGPADVVPAKPVSIAVAVADKIDTLVGFWAIDEKPTGSKDPFALRRAALGVIRIVLENGLRLPLRRAFEAAGKRMKTPPANLAADLLAFFADRLKVHLREQGVRHDLVSAVFALGNEDDLVRLMARVRALQEFLASDNGSNLLVAYNRAANIVRAEEKKDKKSYAGAPDPALFRQDEEKAVAAALDAAMPRVDKALAAEDFVAAMAALAGLRGPLDAFFDKVTVNADDAALRTNRLNLLTRIRSAMDRVADFSKIEG
ncbi:MAG: glycine--tRNA ligase subunit beta [Reyranellaceae bacterium]